MNIADVSIRRPVFITMILSAIAVLGIAAFGMMPVNLFPDIEIPYVMVITVYPGASPEEVETQITEKLEDEFSAIADMKMLQGTSAESMSSVFIEFEIGTDLEARVAEVREKVDMVKIELPDDVEEPMIMKIDPDSFPIMFGSVSAPRPEIEVRKAADDIFKKQLEKISGVATINVSGGKEREIHIDIDRDKLYGYNMSILQVVQAIAKDNLNIPAGKIKNGTDENLVRLMGEYREVSEIEEVEIPTPMGLIKVKDVAKVTDGYKEVEQYARLGGKNAVTIEVVKQSGANTVEVSNKAKEAMDGMVGTYLPEDYDIAITSDLSKFVVDALDDVQSNLLFGALFATLMVLLFLRDIRSTFIIFLAIPTAVVGTFMPIFLAGFSINFMVLMGLAIAVGTLVDNSVVVLENIFRHLEMGKSPMQAAGDGVKEVGLAVIASGSTNICVFIPVAFMKGMTGQFFKEFGLAVVLATLLSIFVAFTLTPALSSRILKKRVNGNGQPDDTGVQFIINKVFFPLFYVFDIFFGALQKIYPRILRFSVHYRWIPMLFTILIFASSIALMVMGKVENEYVPEGDQGEIYVMVEMPSYASLDDTNEVMLEAEEIIKEIPEVIDYSTVAGSDLNGTMSQANPRKGYVVVKLKEFDERERTTNQVVMELRKKMAFFPDATLQIMQANMGGPPGQLPVEIDITGPDLEVLIPLAEEIEEIVRNTPGAMDIKSSWIPGKPEIRVIPNKEKMARMGLDVATMGFEIRTSLEGDDSVQFRQGGDEYDIRIRFDEEARTDVQDIENIPVMTQQGPVKLVNVADVVQDVGPVAVRRKNGFSVIKLEGNTGDISIGKLIENIDKQIQEKVHMPTGYMVQYEGEYSEMKEMGSQMLMAMLLAVLFVYMVMAAQFESFVYPFVVMFTIPLTLVGVVWSLFLTKNTFNMMSQIGIVLLIGIVVNNGILLIDFINQLKQKGRARNNAVLEAGPLRLRPIMITTLSTIFGMIPAAVFAGGGGSFRKPMAIVAIGGLLVSSMLTLVVIPVMYTLVDDLILLVLRIFGKKVDPVWETEEAETAEDNA